MNNRMLVKHDKPHICYNFSEQVCNLKQMTAETFAQKIKGKGTDLNCDNAFELVYTANVKYQSVKNFRESVFASSDKSLIMNSPLFLLDPARVISHRKYKYALE